MPRLPTRDDLGAPPSARSGRAIARLDTSAEGEGLAKLGRDIARAAPAIIDDVARISAELAAGWSRAKEDAEAARFSRFEWDELRRFEAILAALTPAEAEGFADAYASRYGERAAAYRKDVPARLRDAADTQLAGLGERLRAGAVEVERGAMKAASLQALAESIDAVLLPMVQAAAERPANETGKDRLLGEAEDKAWTLIAGNAMLSDEERQKSWTGGVEADGRVTEGLRQKLQARFLDHLSPEEKVGADPARREMTIGERIRMIESGGLAEAANPHSAALGADQFMPGTWRGLVEKYMPELMKGWSAAEIDALRTDPALSERLRDLYLEENARYLAARGEDDTPGNLYLAHFLGPAGALAMLRADPSLPAAVINPKAAEANPSVFFRGEDHATPLSAGEIVAWADSRMRGAQRFDWASRLDAVPAERKIAIAQQAAEALLQREAGRRASERVAYDQRLSSAREAIASGGFGLADWQAASADWLTEPADRAELFDALEARSQQLLGFAGAAAKFKDGGYRFDPFIDDDRRTADIVYEQGTAQGGAGLLEGDEASIAALSAVVDRSGVLPWRARDSLRAGLRSGETEKRNRAFAILDSLYRRDAELVFRSMPEADVRRLQDYQVLSMTRRSDDVAARLDPAFNMEEAQRRARLRAEGETRAAEIPSDDLLQSIDAGFADAAIDGEETPTFATLRRDFDRLFAERYSVSGDEEMAKAQALERLSGKWGMTSVGSSVSLAAYPPEKYQAAIGGSHDWMGDQLANLVAAAAPDARDWFPVATEETERTLSANRSSRSWAPLPYAVGVIDGAGAFRLLADETGGLLRIIFDAEAANRTVSVPPNASAVEPDTGEMRNAAAADAPEIESAPAEETGT